MEKIDPSYYYSRGAEIANSVTHGIGLGLSVAGLVLLIVFAALWGNVYQIVSCTIFGVTLIGLYLASTLYHSFALSPNRKIFKIIDHSAIYLLIAGTYTPFTLGLLRGGWGWSLFGVIWSLAIIGIVLKCLFIGKFKAASVVLYVAMGWLCVIAFRQLAQILPPVSLILLVVGGVTYTLGVIFYIWRSLAFSHPIWHLFVLGGSVCHYLAVLFSLPIGK